MKFDFRLTVERLKALVDPSALLLLALTVGGLSLLNFGRTLVLLEWMAFAGALVAYAIVLSRVAFPFIDLKSLMGWTDRTSPVIAAVIQFVGLLVLALAIWTRP